MNTTTLERLRAFRQAMYITFGCRRDALVEILDALLTAPVIEHPVHLSLAPGFQRTWGSIYDALNAGTMPLPRLEQLVAGQPLETDTAWYAVDASVWPRCDAETSSERGYYHHHTRHSHGQPIVAGWNYSWLVQVPERCSSWTAQLAGEAHDAGGKRQSGGRRTDSLVPLPTRERPAASHLHL
jgi:DDE superfamily endonuclease